MEGRSPDIRTKLNTYIWLLTEPPLNLVKGKLVHEMVVAC